MIRLQYWNDQYKFLLQIHHRKEISKPYTFLIIGYLFPTKPYVSIRTDYIFNQFLLDCIALGASIHLLPYSATLITDSRYTFFYLIEAWHGISISFDLAFTVSLIFNQTPLNKGSQCFTWADTQPIGLTTLPPVRSYTSAK